MEKIKLLIVVLAVLFLASCTQNNDVKFDLQNDPLYFSFTPIKIQSDNLIIELTDYVNDFTDIDSIYFDGGDFSYNKSNKTIKMLSEFTDINPLSSVNFVKSENTYSLVCIKKQNIKSEIKYFPSDSIKPESVKVAGNFNSWNPDNMILAKNGDFWSGTVELSQGIYQYQLVVDGIWQNNPNNDTISNGIGGYNTLLLSKDECETIGFTLQTVSHTDTEITIESSYLPESLFILWQNQKIPIDLNNFSNKRYTFNIPKEAKDVKRSHIRVYASYKNCIANDLLIPLENGKVIMNTELLSRSDKQNNLMYFMLVDRFKDGDSLNNKKLNDPRVEEKADYYGGDLAGINECLKNGYFDELGVNCLWISPIFQNPYEAYQEYPEPRRYFSGYHGYWPISSVDIDTRFGNETIFKSLIDNAHNKEMNVILDFVANHVHEKNPLYAEHPEWATDLYLDDGRINIRIWDECRLTTWFDTFLPSWDFENPEVTDTISDIAINWLTKYQLDGFRHDATKHIPTVFWKTLTKKIRDSQSDKSIYQIGETFGSRDLIDSYVSTGMLDAQFDFNLYFDARNCFADSIGDMKILSESLNASLLMYGSHNLMGNITGNHDLTRFITVADHSIYPGEDDKEAGWSRNIVVENPDSYKKLQNLTAFIISIPGIPCVYYGDEIGMPGAGDPDNRRPMKFTDLSEYEYQTLETFKKLTHIRRNNIEFIYGKTKIIEANYGTIIIERQYFDRYSYIIINQSPEESSIIISKNIINDINKFETHFNSEINELTENYQIILPPYSFEILTKLK